MSPLSLARMTARRKVSMIERDDFVEDREHHGSSVYDHVLAAKTGPQVGPFLGGASVEKANANRVLRGRFVVRWRAAVGGGRGWEGQNGYFGPSQGGVFVFCWS